MDGFGRVWTGAGRFLECFWTVFRLFLKGLDGCRRVFGRFLKCFWTVFGVFLNGFWSVFGGFGRVPEGLKTPPADGLANSRL